MRLREYEVEGLAQVEHETIVFRDDAPNLIVGPNEAGKTHLMLGLCGMFFGLEDPDRMKPWSGPTTMHGSLHFEDEAGETVYLDRDYTDDTVTVRTNGQQWSARWDGKAADTERFLRSLDGWLGFREQSIFTETTFIRQAEMTAAEIKGVAPEIKRLITGTMEASYERVLTDLNETLDGLRRPPGVRKESRLERQQETVRRLEEQRRAAQERQVRILRLRQIRDRLAADMQQKGVQETRLQEQMNLVGNLEGLEARQLQLRKQLQAWDGQLEALGRAEAALLAATRERDRYAVAAATTRQELIDFDRNVRDAEAVLERPSQPTTPGKPLRSRFLSKPKEQPSPLSDLAPEELTELIWNAREARDTALRRMNVASLQQGLDLRERYDRADSEVVRAQTFLDTLGTEPEVLAQREGVARELGTVTAQLDRLAGSAVSSNQIQNRDAFRKTLTSLKDAIAVLQTDATEVHRKLQLEGEGEEDMTQIERELERAQAGVDDTKERIAAHELAIGTLKDCVVGFHDHYLDGVMADASSMFAELTDGRYERVHLRPGDLEPLVDTAERSRIPSTQLSRGTREQLYFVLRVALARTLANDRGLPMILDDPFVNFDPQRLERTVALLRVISQRTQIIFFTADPRYEEWFEPVLRLGVEPMELVASVVA
ncbi:MAG TPA: AAA family ATPase [Chloroflexota bacterium]